MRIGFIGAGRMGRPMVARLVAAGHDVRALGRSGEKRAAIGQLGAHTVAEIAAVSAGADAVVVCVFTDEQMRQVCLADGLVTAIPAGSALVLHTTGSPSTVELGARLGVPESALLAALPHGSAASRVLDVLAAGGSVASFIETAGEFVGKDVAVVRGIAAELGSSLGVLDDVIDAGVTGAR